MDIFALSCIYRIAEISVNDGWADNPSPLIDIVEIHAAWWKVFPEYRREICRKLQNCFSITFEKLYNQKYYN